LTKTTPKIQPPQAPPGGGDVPGGVRKAVGWGDGRMENWT